MIPLVKPAIFPEQEQFLKELVHHPEYHTTGHFSHLCETWLETRYTGSRVWAVSSCTHALEAAFMALNLPAGSEVVMPSWNFVSAGNAAVRAGLKPVWADIDGQGNICPESVERVITSNTRALLVMHYMGIPAQMDTLLEIATRNHLFVVEDAAYGLFSEYEEKPLGSFGHISCISFDHTKPLHAGRGGALVVNDSRWVEPVEKIIDMGTDKAAFLRGESPTYQWVSMGSKFRMPEASAAILWAGLQHYGEIRNELEQVLSRYNRESGYKIHGRAGAFVVLPQEADRPRVIQQFQEAGIYCTFHYQPLHHSVFGSRFTAHSELLERTNLFADTLLRLPLYAGIKHEEVSYIIQVLKQILRS